MLILPSFSFFRMLSCLSKPIYLFIFCLGPPPLFWGLLFWDVCMCVYTDVNVLLMFFLRSVSLWKRGWALHWRFLFTWYLSTGAADMPSAAGSCSTPGLGPGQDLHSHLWLGLEGTVSGAFTVLPSELFLGQSLPAVTCSTFLVPPGKAKETDVSCSTYGCHRGCHQLQSFQSQHPLSLKGLSVIFQMFALSSSTELISTLAHWAGLLHIRKSLPLVQRSPHHLLTLMLTYQSLWSFTTVGSPEATHLACYI